MRQFSKNLGSTMMMAVFILVVMSLTAQFIINIVNNSTAGTNILVQGQNAYFAARSGWEWAAIYARLNGNNTCPTSPTTFTINQGSLLGFQVKVTCTKAGAVLTITSVATYGTFGKFGYSTKTYVDTYP